MECNKDEAMRAKSIAEAKFEQKDYAGSKKFALKAQALYPRLDGISQLLTTLDVFSSAERKVKGQVNWYAVLGVDPTADDVTIKTKYRKLALVIHPDKNPLSGADGAFKLISEAWTLLSDKSKRLAYNQISGFKGSHPKPPVQSGGGSSASRAYERGLSPHVGPSSRNAGPRDQNGCPPAAPPSSTERPVSKSVKRKPVAPKKPTKRAKAKDAAGAKPAPEPSSPIPKASFWTICRECNLHCEYPIMFRNCTLLCTECRRPFVALEIPRPPGY